MKKYGIILTLLMITNIVQPDVKVRTGIDFNIFNLVLEQDVPTKIFLGALTLLAATKIGYDMNWHATYEAKANMWYQMLDNAITKHKIQSVTDEKLISLFSPFDHDDITEMHLWVNNSYNSWFTPWNWTSSQKISFQKLQLIEILTLHTDLLALQDSITGEQVVKSFRNKYSAISMYPLIHAYAALDKQLELIATIKNHKFSHLIDEMVVYLQYFKILLRQENEYQLEVQAKRAHDLQKELINAVITSGNRRY